MDSWLWDPVNKTYGPGAWSWFHLLWLGILVAGIFCVIKFLSLKHDVKINNLITRIVAVLLLISEVIRQIMFIKINVSEGHGYPFAKFPFDLCAIPLFTAFVSSFFSDPNHIVKKYADTLSLFIGFIGGLGVLMSPATVLKTPYVVASLNTMFCHVLLVVYGVHLYISKSLYKEHTYKTLIPLYFSFPVLLVIAFTLNEIVYHCYLVPNNLTEVELCQMNCFFISRFFGPPPYPVINMIWAKDNVGRYILYMISFITLFLGLLTLIHYAASGSHIIYTKHQKKKEEDKSKPEIKQN